jgi:hypothetical protein
MFTNSCNDQSNSHLKITWTAQTAATICGAVEEKLLGFLSSLE